MLNCKCVYLGLTTAHNDMFALINSNLPWPDRQCGWHFEISSNSLLITYKSAKMILLAAILFAYAICHYL